MDDVAAVRAGERLLFEECVRRTPGARMDERDGLLLIIGAVPSRVLVNTIVTVTPGVGADAVERALAVYDELGHDLGIWTSEVDDAGLEPGLEALGFQKVETMPGMVLTGPPPAEAVPAGANLCLVESEEDRERWIEADLAGLMEGVSEVDREAVTSAFSTLDGLTGGPISAWYAEVDGRGAAAALSVVDPATGVGAVGWVGTDPAYRNRGLGRAVTLAVTRHAFELGARIVMLQASVMGEPVYRKLGYRAVSSHGWWLREAI